jgi:hypothetical protein
VPHRVVARTVRCTTRVRAAPRWLISTREAVTSRDCGSRIRPTCALDEEEPLDLGLQAGKGGVLEDTDHALFRGVPKGHFDGFFGAQLV